MKSIRVLSVRQPWAGAFFLHGKDVENRSWPTKHRGPLVIHASSKIVVPDPDGLSFTEPDSDAWECAALLGIVTVVDCVRDYDSRWAASGCWHWVIKDAELFKRPIAMLGKLNLWSVPLSRVLPVLR